MRNFAHRHRLGLPARLLLGSVCWLAFWQAASAADDDLPQRAAAALGKACRYMVDEVSTEGGYMWRYTADLSQRAGENVGGEQTVWIQPPGTPSMGSLYLEAYQATGDEYYLDAARRAALCLVRGQLHSGGWTYRIEFKPEDRGKLAFRVDGEPSERADNKTVLDDNTTQSALHLMMQVDKALDFQDETIHEATLFALNSILTAQYPNGAWPQRFTAPPNPDDFPVLPASYPPEWSRTFPKEDYNSYYTFNDDAMGDVVEVMFEATEVYGDDRYANAARRCGDFLLLSRMPEPQPAWAQQYNAQMHPAWARKFEPPSITGGESQSNLLTLLEIYRRTGDAKYLEPIPRTIEYLRACLRPDGRLPRFLELHSNRPLYFTLDYELTYSDASMPTHYAFIVSASRLDRAERDLAKYRELSPGELARLSVRRIKPPTRDQKKAAEKAIAALDKQGRWLETGTVGNSEEGPIVSTRLFIENARDLTSYLASVRAAAEE